MAQLTLEGEAYYNEYDEKILMMFPQRTFHHNGYLIGNRKALEALKGAIDEALSGNKHSPFVLHPMGSTIVHPGDNESYNVIVILDDDLKHSDHPVCYTDPKAAEAYSEGSVAMSPDEAYVMAAGVHCHLKYKEFLEPENEKPVKTKGRSTNKK